MIEITFIDLVLLVWASVATGLAVTFRREAKMSTKLMLYAVEYPHVYEQMREAWALANKKSL